MTDQRKINKALEAVRKILESEMIPDNAVGQFVFTLNLQSGGVSGSSKVQVNLKAEVNV